MPDLWSSLARCVDWPEAEDAGVGVDDILGADAGSRAVLSIENGLCQYWPMEMLTKLTDIYLGDRTFKQHLSSRTSHAGLSYSGQSAEQDALRQ